MKPSRQPDASQESLAAILRSAAGQAWRARTDLQLYHLLFSAIAVAALSPLAAWAFRLAATSSGKAAVGNLELLAHLLTPLGLALACLAVVISLTLVLLDLAGLVLICYAASKSRRLSSIDALRTVAARAPRVLGASLAAVLLVGIVAAPFLLAAWSVADWLLVHDINFYLYEHPPEFWTAAVWVGLILALGAAASLLVAAPLVFVLPEVLVGGHSVAGAIRSSYHIVRRQRWRVTLVVAAVLIAWQLAALAANVAVLGLGQAFIDRVHWPASAMIPLLATITSVGILLQYAITFAAMAWGCAAVVRLYRDAQADFTMRPAEPVSSPRSNFNAALARRVVPVIAIAAVAIAAVVTRQVLVTTQFEDQVGIIAHRGASLAAPENSLASVRQAIADRATGVEIDVQRTRDGQIVVVHDADMMRLAHSPLVIYQSTLEELRQLEFSGERVATLDEIIDLTKGHAKLVVELKSLGAPSEPLVADVVATLRRREVLDQAAVMSFSYAEIREVRRLEPRLEVGFLVSARLGDISRLEVDFLAVSRRQATASLVAAAHGAGRRVYVWTINDERGMTEMIDRGVDSIITKDPALLVRILQQREELTPLDRLILRFKSLYFR